MSDQPDQQPANDTTDDAATNESQESAQTDGTDWKAKAREWERRAKENKDAAARLAAIEEANKTEAQKQADRLSAAEADAVAARREALCYRVATEYHLTPDDAAALQHVTDEDAMRKLAARLAPPAPTDVDAGDAVALRVNSQGRQTQAKPNKDAAARSVFGI
jgi:hypothetical protein